MDIRIISIGTLSHHPLWGERGAVRTPHATTTLIRSGDRTILVDPGLPPQAVAAHLHERAGLSPGDVTDVFLTNFRPAHRAGIGAFEHARWWISEAERESIGLQLVGRFDAESDEQIRDLLQQEIALLQRFKAAPDQLAERVDLFPLPGYTPGTCGLLIPLAQSTVLIASDAVPTVEHLLHGQVLQGGYDVEQAMESFKEALEIADFIVPGHDNLVPNPTRAPF
ncbi:MAG: MBL fold metallo-hydrolase [Phycisphaera sp.]|nr:MBL fold metallo-hydrolase [Phycisphaera sp.]